MAKPTSEQRPGVSAIFMMPPAWPKSDQGRAGTARATDLTRFVEVPITLHSDGPPSFDAASVKKLRKEYMRPRESNRAGAYTVKDSNWAADPNAVGLLKELEGLLRQPGAMGSGERMAALWALLAFQDHLGNHHTARDLRRLEQILSAHAGRAADFGAVNQGTLGHVHPNSEALHHARRAGQSTFLQWQAMASQDQAAAKPDLSQPGGGAKTTKKRPTTPPGFADPGTFTVGT